jgi:hypothetical protein
MFIAMASIPEDVRDDRYNLSMTDLMALMDIHTPETCYPRALYTMFLSQFAFDDKKATLRKDSGGWRY